ncbi:TIGR02594 family protein [Bosea sp. 2KB_26]|uniref:TIGR02594 family protein n=1 Tax=Bosea sp. 2KB_26 TaxID=3237475 RepID=UPI003F927772
MLPARYAYLADPEKPRWLNSALAELGVSEVAGARSNPRILDYRNVGKTPFGGDDGAVPWCAIFVNAMLEKSGTPGSGSAMARSYVKHAGFEKLVAPMLGCIAVKSSNRGRASGHVGFYVGEDTSFIYLLGGNQNDSVNFSAFRRAEFVGYFWPKDRPKPAAPWDKPYRLPPIGAKPAPVRES